MKESMSQPERKRTTVVKNCRRFCATDSFCEGTSWETINKASNIRIEEVENKLSEATFEDEKQNKMSCLAGFKIAERKFLKRCVLSSSIRDRFRKATRTPPMLGEGSKASLFLAALGITVTCYVRKETAGEHFHSHKYRQCFLAAEMTLATLMEATRTITTQMDYLEHDIQDYDIYINNPTAEDLPYLMNQFEEHGKEVWPWIWTHSNDAGPHFVFVGVNVDTLDQIRKLRSKSPAINILVIASEESIIAAASEAGDPNIYEETHCGIVSDATLELLNAESKILMLSDERVISFDSLTII